MLLLTRKTSQSIVISGRITLTVTRIVGNRVALAFDAPQHVHIRRSELPVLDDVIDDELDRPPATSSRGTNEANLAPKRLQPVFPR